MTDYERGVAALRALGAIDGTDWDKAGDAIFAVLEMGYEPDEVYGPLVEAVGRIVKDPPQ
jgi:hypothetical protein